MWKHSRRHTVGVLALVPVPPGQEAAQDGTPLVAEELAAVDLLNEAGVLHDELDLVFLTELLAFCGVGVRVLRAVIERCDGSFS